MILIKLFGLKNKKRDVISSISVQNGSKNSVFSFPQTENIRDGRIYGSLRRALPVVDAAITKIVRLTDGFSVSTDDKNMQDRLLDFSENVPVGICGQSLRMFISSYLDSLLTYGNAVGEMIIDKNGYSLAGLVNVSIENIEIERVSGESPLEKKIFAVDGSRRKEIIYPERILFTALNPPSGKIYGVSLLQGIPCLGSILMRIYECIGKNYERLGNIRYSVTYKPSDDPSDKVYAGDRIKQIAKEWSEGMKASARGEVRDFISSGNVEIKVIGADSPLLDTEIPVRQLLEQIIAKLGIPPFLLGLSWSSTERMSQQQSDILTSELEYYRRILTPVIKKICTCFLRMNGSLGNVFVEWENINLQDEVELANARLVNAQAEKLENENLENNNY
ncbi:MAG: phage portal protein [Oscillospiraceae bacterium]|nr:phage portal protein [Oscillospiraceae bacterium]MDY3257069.1 serine/threonine protein phosphatase [Ruminococcus callidus]